MFGIQIPTVLESRRKGVFLCNGTDVLNRTSSVPISVLHYGWIITVTSEWNTGETGYIYCLVKLLFFHKVIIPLIIICSLRSRSLRFHVIFIIIIAMFILIIFTLISLFLLLFWFWNIFKIRKLNLLNILAGIELLTLLYSPYCDWKCPVFRSKITQTSS